VVFSQNLKPSTRILTPAIDAITDDLDQVRARRALSPGGRDFAGHYLCALDAA
jgi:hypothetical protein